MPELVQKWGNQCWRGSECPYKREYTCCSSSSLQRSSPGSSPGSGCSHPTAPDLPLAAIYIQSLEITSMLMAQKKAFQELLRIAAGSWNISWASVAMICLSSGSCWRKRQQNLKHGPSGSCRVENEGFALQKEAGGAGLGSKYGREMWVDLQNLCTARFSCFGFLL